MYVSYTYTCICVKYTYRYIPLLSPALGAAAVGYIYVYTQANIYNICIDIYLSSRPPLALLLQVLHLRVMLSRYTLVLNTYT